MRFALIAAASITAAAATFFAVAQPKPTLPPPDKLDQQLMPIDWEEVRDAVKNQRLPRGKLRQMRIATDAPQPSLPMLLPFEPTIAAAETNVFPRPDSYAASMRMGDITVEVHGERRVIVVDAKDPMARMMQAKQQIATLAGASVPFALDKTEGGFDLTFGRFGAAYLVSIECQKPETDERCVKPDFVKLLGERMGLFGQDHP